MAGHNVQDSAALLMQAMERDIEASAPFKRQQADRDARRMELMEQDVQSVLRFRAELSRILSSFLGLGMFFLAIVAYIAFSK